MIKGALEAASQTQCRRVKSKSERTDQPPQPNLSDRIFLKYLEREGPWLILASVISHEAKRTRELERQLDKAYDLLRTQGDDGRQAFIESIKAFATYAQPIRFPIHRPAITRERLAAYTYGLDAFGDLCLGIERRIFERPKQLDTTHPGKLPLHQFKGRVAAFVQLLWEYNGRRRGSKKEAYDFVYDICKPTADRLGIAFEQRRPRHSHSTPKSWHTDVTKFNWVTLLEVGNFRASELGSRQRDRIERLEFLNIMSLGRQAVARGEDAQLYCEGLAKRAFGAHLLPSSKYRKSD